MQTLWTTAGTGLAVLLAVSMTAGSALAESGAQGPEASDSGTPAATTDASSEAAAGATAATHEIVAAPELNVLPEQASTPAKDTTRLSASEIISERQEARRFSASGTAEYRGMLVTDQDPSNDIFMRYAAVGTVNIVKGLVGLLKVEARQAFWREPDDTAWRLQDTAFGLRYNHELELANTGYKLRLRHQLVASVPTSRVSVERGLIIAPSWVSSVRSEVFPGIDVGGELGAVYRFYRYSGQQGPGGVQNSRADGSTRLWVDYTPLQSERWGTVTVGVDASATWRVKYDALDAYGSDASSTRYWSQLYGWDAYLDYMPISNLVVSASLEHGGPVRNDGVINMYFIKREDTQLVFSVTGIY